MGLMRFSRRFVRDPASGVLECVGLALGIPLMLLGFCDIFIVHPYADIAVESARFGRGCTAVLLGAVLIGVFRFMALLLWPKLRQALGLRP